MHLPPQPTSRSPSLSSVLALLPGGLSGSQRPLFGLPVCLPVGVDLSPHPVSPQALSLLLSPCHTHTPPDVRLCHRGEWEEAGVHRDLEAGTEVEGVDGP